MLSKIVVKNENLLKENETLNNHINSLVKLLRDKDTKLKIYNKNSDFINKFSDLNFLRLKICVILKNLFLTNKEKEIILLKFHLYFWKGFLKKKENYKINYTNFFTLRNNIIKQVKFRDSELKISKNFLDDLNKEYEKENEIIFLEANEKKFNKKYLTKNQFFFGTIEKLLQIKILKIKFLFFKNFIRQTLENKKISSFKNVEEEKKLNFDKNKIFLEKCFLFYENIYKKNILMIKFQFMFKFFKVSNFNFQKNKFLLYHKLIIKNKLKYLLRKKFYFELKNSFEIFKNKIFFLKKLEDKEELEFFQSTNYSLIMLNTLERIFSKHYNIKEFSFRLFYNLKLKYFTYNNLSLQINDEEKKIILKKFLTHKIIFSKFSKNFLVKTFFYKWKFLIFKEYSNEQTEILNSIPNLEAEFSSKINDIEKAYKEIIQKTQNDYDKKILEQNTDIQSLKSDIKKITDINTELNQIIENENQTQIENNEQ